MAYYLVKAKPLSLTELKARLDSGEIATLRPFGGEMQQCLQKARIDTEGWVTWEEQCFCNPPLAQERAVLDKYFSELQTTRIQQGEGWATVEALPSLWKST